MNGFLLDTAPLAAYYLKRPHAMEAIDALRAAAPIRTSLFTYGEVVEYLRGESPIEGPPERLRKLLNEIALVNITFDVMDRYADLRRTMRVRKPGLIGDIDTIIAASAIVHELTLVTTDRDFLRVPNLDLMLLAPRTFVPVE